MTLTRATDLTVRPPRIDYAQFAAILKERGSPAYPEASSIWHLLVTGGVDPSFALGQFHVESLMGKAGHAAVTKSWGNMLWDSAWTPTRASYAPGNGYTYARYPTWSEGVVDYVAYVQRYAATNDARYDADRNGVNDTIDETTARWTGKPVDAVNHDTYVQIILSLINDVFEYQPGVFIEVGDRMITVDHAHITSGLRYPVPNGTPLYRGTDGDVLKLASFATSPGLCRFLGPVGAEYAAASWPWGAVVVGVKDSAGVVRERVLFVKDPVKSRVTAA